MNILYQNIMKHLIHVGKRHEKLRGLQLRMEIMEKETDRESEIKRMKMDEDEDCVVINEKRSNEEVSFDL